MRVRFRLWRLAFVAGVFIPLTASAQVTSQTCVVGAGSTLILSWDGGIAPGELLYIGVTMTTPTLAAAPTVTTNAGDVLPIHVYQCGGASFTADPCVGMAAVATLDAGVTAFIAQFTPPLPIQSSIFVGTLRGVLPIPAFGFGGGQGILTFPSLVVPPTPNLLLAVSATEAGAPTVSTAYQLLATCGNQVLALALNVDAGPVFTAQGGTTAIAGVTLAFVTTDAGASDAGSPPPADAGNSTRDAGSDAGGSTPDAGGADAGAPDAGPLGADGGNIPGALPASAYTVGCDCRSSGTGAVWLAAALVATRARRRRSPT